MKTVKSHFINYNKSLLVAARNLGVFLLANGLSPLARRKTPTLHRRHSSLNIVVVYEKALNKISKIISLLNILFLSSSCLAEEGVFSLVNLTKSPIPRVHDSINVISGNWVDQEHYETTTGPDPYVLLHSYISSNLGQGSLADGWDFYHPLELQAVQPQGATFHKSLMNTKFIEKKEIRRNQDPKPLLVPDTNSMGNEVNNVLLYYRESGGAKIVFHGDQEAHHFWPKLQKTGYLFSNSIKNPSRIDLHLTEIHWNSHSDEFEVTLSDGTLRTYRFSKHYKHKEGVDLPRDYQRSYLIKKETFPSGNKRFYHYDGDDVLEKIQTESSDGKYVINKVYFKNKKDHIDVTTSNGRTTRFCKKEINEEQNGNKTTAVVISEIEHPGKPKIQYEYSKKDSHHPRRIEEKRKKNGFYQAVRYYKDHTTKVDGKKENVPKEHRYFFNNRVSELWTKSLKGQEPACSHTFYYKEYDKEHAEAFVYEDDGAVQGYLWDKKDRPVWHAMYQTKNELVAEEKFSWGKDDDEGRLLHRMFFDEKKNPRVAISFTYDKSGNVLSETIKGTITGHDHPPLYIEDHEPHHGEEITTYASYSKDGRSLKVKECDALGNYTYYEYEKKRDLLIAKFVCNQKSIVFREFYTYDSAALCIETTSDDGSSEDKDDLSHVTRRTTHKIQPRYETPYFGVPQQEDWYITTQHKKVYLKGIRYTHDDKGRVLVKEILDSTKTPRKRWKYKYDALDRVIETCDPVGRRELIEYDESGNVSVIYKPEATTYIKRDLFNRVIEEKTVFPDGTESSINREYSRSGRSITETDSRGRHTTTTKDVLGRPLTISHPKLSIQGSIQKPQESFHYSGLVETHILPTGAKVETKKNIFGKPIRITNPFGATSTFFYDKRLRLVEENDAAGLSTTYEYDIFDRPTKSIKSCSGIPSETITKKYNAFEILEESLPTQTISYSYDVYGRKSREVRKDLLTGKTASTSFYYDSLHRLIKTVQEDLALKEHLTYDLADRVIERKTIGGTSVLSHTKITYDLSGRVIEEASLRANTFASTKTTYGSYGLPSIITYPDGTATHLFYKPRFKSDDGLFYYLRTTVDAKGVSVEELLDANDQVRSMIIKDPYGTIIQKTLIDVSILGKPILQKDFCIDQGAETSINKTAYTYDKVGKVTSITYAEGKAESSTWHYRYNAIGQKIEEEKPSSIVLKSVYDAKGRLTHFSSSDGSISSSYFYNNQDLPEKVLNETTQKATYRSYDGFGHVTEETLENDLTSRFATSSRGAIEEITYPDSSKTTYRYEFGLLKRVERTGLIPYSYDIVTRDPSGIITKALLPKAGGEVFWTLDTMGRLRSMEHPTFTEKRVQFDATSCLLERTLNGTKETFSYDYLSQLTSDNGRAAHYDSLYHRKMNEGVTASFNARGQMTTQGRNHYTYDKDGRRIQDARFQYTYDALDRLIRIENDSLRIEYAYDTFHRRIASSTYEKTPTSSNLISKEKFLWLGENEVGSTDEHRNMKSLRILSEGNAERASGIGFEINSALYIPLYDLSGNVRLLLDDQGNTVETLDYTAFGVQRRSGTISPWSFSSKRQDPYTGFLFFGRRYYDQETASWLTQDPLGTKAGPNMYAYVKNNPLTSYDLYGLVDEQGMMNRFIQPYLQMQDIEYYLAKNNLSLLPCTGTPDYFANAPNGFRAPPPGTPSIALQDGTAIYANTFYEDGFYIYPEGENFFKNHQGQDLTGKLGMFFNGIQTTCFEDMINANSIKDMHKDLINVLVPYNATHGLANDIVEVGEQIYSKNDRLSLKTASLERNFYEKCESYGITIGDITKIGHSQGAATLTNTYNLPTMKNYRALSGDKITFGGIKTPRDFINFRASWDLIPFANLLNDLDNWLHGTDHIQIVGEPQGPLKAHSFQGPAYQEALRNYFENNMRQDSSHD